MKKISAFLTFLILVGIFIPAVSAETIVSETLTQFTDTSSTGTIANAGGTYPYPADQLVIENIQNYPELSYIIIERSGVFFPNLAEGRTDFSYTFNGQSRPGVVYKAVSTNALGTVSSTRLTIFLNDWNIGTLSGTSRITMPIFGGTSLGAYSKSGSTGSSPIWIGFSASGSTTIGGTTTYTVASAIPWKNIITIDENENNYTINLARTVDAKPYASTLSIKDGDTIVYTNSVYGSDLELLYMKNAIDLVTITNPAGSVFNYPLTGGAPDEPSTSENGTINLYIRNSQTNALIAGAQAVISAGFYDPAELIEVSNTTLPSGTKTYTLQPTGGGLPNPDFYRLITTAEGYNSIMPYIDFEVDRATSIHAYLDPTGGAPEDENNTFIDFYVRDLAANGISGATVNFGGYTLITNSAGYTIFEVGKNKNYSWTVSKSGYGSVTGNAVIGADPRHTINAVIAPAVTPATPTPIPTSTPISPTPTMTSPTGEPVSNWLEWFAAHFGGILGGGVEIGKIFMWLCFSVPVGVYVAKEAKAGAAGFMAGAGVVTLFFVLIGWVPIWLLVFIALIIGLLYAKVFNNSDNGGGR